MLSLYHFDKALLHYEYIFHPVSLKQKKLAEVRATLGQLKMKYWTGKYQGTCPSSAVFLFESFQKCFSFHVFIRFEILKKRQQDQWRIFATYFTFQKSFSNSQTQDQNKAETRVWLQQQKQNLTQLISWEACRGWTHDWARWGDDGRLCSNNWD